MNLNLESTTVNLTDDPWENVAHKCEEKLSIQKASL